MKHFIAGVIAGIVLTVAVLVGSDALYEYRAYSAEFLRDRPDRIEFEINYHGWRPAPGAEPTVVLWRQRIRVPWPNTPNW